MFPPGNASAALAITGHLRYRDAWFADLIGPLLVPAKAWDQFAAAHRDAGAPVLSVVLIGTTTLPTTVPDGVSVVGFEVAVADVPLPIVPRGLSLAAEITPGAKGYGVLAAVGSCVRPESDIASGRVLAKFRTGGTTTGAFPSEDVLAEFICAASSLGAPLKLTAGLHHAVRFSATDTGFEHHGFLNVMLAVARARRGDDRVAVAEVLAERDPATVASAVEALSPGLLDDVRRRFVSFGCCGVTDPVNDLVDLSLITPGSATPG